MDVLIWFAVLVVNFKGEDKKRFGHDQPKSAQGLLSGSQAHEFQYSGEEAFITQPAVTAQVKLFEDYLELKLFKKKGGKLYLTDEGKTIYEYAQKLFEYEREIENAVEEIKKLGRGTLRLGTARTYARHFMPFLISHFRELYPQIKIRLDEGSSQDMIQSLLDLRNELAVVANTKESADICFVSFSQEELILILPPDHLLAKKKAVSFKELTDEPIIMKETGSGTRRLVNELFAKNGYSPKVLMEMSDAEMIKLLVQHGEGISFLLCFLIPRPLAAGCAAGDMMQLHEIRKNFP